MLPPLTEVVKMLIIINVVMFLGTMIGLDPSIRGMLAMHYPASEYFQPFQIVTHMFMHDGRDVAHLLFNMFGLFMFGVPLEMGLGPKRFLLFYLGSGLGALLFYLGIQFIQINYMSMAGVVNESMWGASGAVFGLLAGYGILYANQVVQMIFPPVKMKAKYFVLIFAALELYLGFSGANTGIAHFAHIGGAVAGVLILASWKLLKTGR